MKSKVILTAAELDLFTCIDEKPDTASRIAHERGLDVRSNNQDPRLFVCHGASRKNG